MTSKMRLDLAAVVTGVAPTRQKAQGLILAGSVSVNGKMNDKPGSQVGEGDVIALIAPACPYVSRGGLKLRKGLDVFGVSPAGRVAIDVGASTGGFTDCMLQAGASHVYAVDSGYGQLDSRLRNDSRVTALERENFRYLAKEKIPEPVSLATVDCSFISSALITSRLGIFLAPGSDVIVLIKPQFEAGKKDAGKGVIRDPALHESVLEKALESIQATGLCLVALTHSPLKGPKGNIEFLAHFTQAGRAGRTCPDARAAVRAAHDELD